MLLFCLHRVSCVSCRFLFIINSSSDVGLSLSSSLSVVGNSFSLYRSCCSFDAKNFGKNRLLCRAIKMYSYW